MVLPLRYVNTFLAILWNAVDQSADNDRHNFRLLLLTPMAKYVLLVFSPVSVSVLLLALFPFSRLRPRLLDTEVSSLALSSFVLLSVSGVLP